MNPTRSKADAVEFVMSFVENSDRYKQQFKPIWQEVLSNFMVDPDGYGGGSSTPTPYLVRGASSLRKNIGVRDTILLKDPETHKVVMTYAAKIVKAVFGDRRSEFVQARPVGWEDAQVKAPEVTRLLKYAFRRPGHFRTMVEATIDMLLFGTGIIESPWDYRTVRMPVRTVSSDSGYEYDSVATMETERYNDVRLRVVAPEDFYPDPGECRLEDMSGVAKAFRITKARAYELAESGVYDRAAVARACERTWGGDKQVRENWRVDLPRDRKSVSDLEVLVGYDYSGTVPWSDDRSIVTILNGEDVRNRDYPYADPELHYHALVINPMNGRFYGVAPGEVIRWDQSFADAVKMLVAAAIVRSVYPPIAYDNTLGMDIDLAALRAWDPRALVPIAGGPSNVGTIPYNANFQAAFMVQQQLTASMQGGSGAMGGIQGENGPDRESASVGVQRMQFALDRPELVGMLLDNESLPSLARGILRRYQQFLPDTAALKQRIGEQPESLWIGDIMGDFDVEFTGSRQAMTRQEKLQAFDRIVSYAGVAPAFQMFLPNLEMARKIVADVLEMPDLVAAVGSPETVMMNMMAQQAAGQAAGISNGNGVAQAAEPAGALPAQMTGGALGA